MDKATAQRLIRHTFQAPFDRERYQQFINELCNGFDQGKAKKNMTVPDAFKAHVKSCQRLGTFISPDGELADVLVMQLTESWKLERSRTALRDYVAHKLKRGEGSDNAYKEAGLIAFVAPDAAAWRFSYIRMDYETKRDPHTGKIKAEERLTPARRYSYRVGADEECHTAQTRFLPLLQNTTIKPALAQIEDAFSVESVTKEFFNEYARLFKATDEALCAIVERQPALKAEFFAKNIRTVDFAKKLLGQIVFLYFIQKKGWLGVNKGEPWGNGPRHFLRQRADQAIGNGQCLFHAVMEPLFYDTLATDRGAEAWCPLFQSRIPFLNSGLFEPLAGYDWKAQAIPLPNILFSNQDRTASGDIGTGILDVFDRYNFTVNEAEPLEKEVAIDPEMLGKVFENLIEENRRKGLGAFYTPREIVHYMCQESLIDYLDTVVNACEIPPLPKAAPLNSVGAMTLEANHPGTNAPPLLNQGGELSNLHPFSPPFQGGVAQSAGVVESATSPDFVEFNRPLLKKGGFRSGTKPLPRADIEAFIREGEQAAHYESARKDGTVSYQRRLPQAIEEYAEALDEALKSITVCDPAIGSGAFPVGMMTEIVRARTALTPYFAMRSPVPPAGEKLCSPRPLAGEGSGERAESERTPYHFKRHAIQNSLYGVDIDSGAVEIAKLRLWLSLVVDEEDVQQIKPLPNLDYKIVAGNSLLGVQKNLFNDELFKRLEQLKPLFFNESDRSKKAHLKQQIDELIHQLTQSREVFDFEIYFSEVFHKKSGFDVVIGNPPYVRQEEIKELKPLLKPQYECFTGTADLFTYFYERGIKLLHEGGQFAFITSNKWYRSGYGEKLRGWLTKNTRIHELIDFGDAPVFEAIAYPSIIRLERRMQTPLNADHAFRALTWKPGPPLADFVAVVRQQSFAIPQASLDKSGWRLEGVAKRHLLDKLRAAGTPLGEYCNGRFYYGIKTGLNEAFVVDRTTHDRLIAEHPSSAEVLKPFLRGRDVKRWQVEPKDLWLIFTSSGIDINRFPSIKRHLWQFKELLERRAGKQAWFELQASPADQNRFEQPKIVYPDIAFDCNFAFDIDKIYVDCTLFFIPQAPIHFLPILNADITKYFISQICPTIRGGFRRFKSIYVSKIPIPAATPTEQIELKKLAQRILDNPKAADVADLEAEINERVYRLYGLTRDEIAVIEGDDQAS